MKAFKIIAKIVVALAAIAGAVYVFATYGDKIVAWCKNLLKRIPCCCNGECECECTEDSCETPVEEEVAEEAAEEAPAEEAPVAEENDFEG